MKGKTQVGEHACICTQNTSNLCRQPILTGVTVLMVSPVPEIRTFVVCSPQIPFKKKGWKLKVRTEICVAIS